MNTFKQLFQTDQNVYKIDDTGSGVWTVINVIPCKYLDVLEGFKYLIENKATRARNTLPQGLLRLADEGGTLPNIEQMDSVPSLSRNGTTDEVSDLNLTCASFLSDISDSFYACLGDDGNEAEDGFDTDISDSVFRDIHTGLSPKIEVQSGFSPNIGQVQSGSPPNICDVQSGSPNISQVQSGSSPNIAQVKSGSSPNIAQVKSGSSPNIAQVQSGSSPNIAQVQSGSSPNIAQVQSGSSPNIAHVQFGSPPNIGQVQSGSPHNICEVQSGSPNIGQVQSGSSHNISEVLPCSTLNIGEVQSCSPLNISKSPPNIGGRDSFFIDVYAEDIYTEDVYTEGLPYDSSSSNILQLQNPSPSSIHQFQNSSPSSIHEVQSPVAPEVLIRQAPGNEIHPPADGVSIRQAPQVTPEPHVLRVPINQIPSSSSPNINQVQPSSFSHVEEECNFEISTPLLCDVQEQLVNDLGRLEGENSGKTSGDNNDSRANQLHSRGKDDQTALGPKRIKLSLKVVKTEGSQKLWKVCESSIKSKPVVDIGSSNTDSAKIKATTCKGSTRNGSQEQDTAKASPRVCAAALLKNASCSTKTATAFLTPLPPPPTARSGCSIARTRSTSPSPSTTSSTGCARTASTTAAMPASSSTASRHSGTSTYEVPDLTEDFVEAAASRKMKQPTGTFRFPSTTSSSGRARPEFMSTTAAMPASSSRASRRSRTNRSASTGEVPNLTEDETFVEEEAPRKKKRERKHFRKKSQRQNSSCNGIEEVLTPELHSSPLHETDSSWNQEINEMLQQGRSNGFRDEQSTTEFVTELTLNVIGGCDTLGVSDRDVRVVADDDGDVLGDYEIHLESNVEEGQDILDCIPEMKSWLEDVKNDISKDGKEVRDLKTAEIETERIEDRLKIFESYRPKMNLLAEAKERHYDPDDVQYVMDAWDIVEELFQDRKEELRVLHELYSSMPNGGHGIENASSEDYQPRFLTDSEIKAIGDDADGQETSRRKQLVFGLFKDYLLKCGEEREITEIPLKELSVAMGSFWYTLTKRDGTHHDTSTLHTWFSRLNVVIKVLLGGINPCNHPDFEACRTLKKAKLRKSKEQPGNGMRQHQADVIYPEEVQFMFYIGVLNVSSAWGILRTIYFYLGAVCNHRAFTDMANLTMENVKITYDEEGRVLFAEVCLQKQKRDQGDKEVPVKRPRIPPMDDKSRCFFTAWFKLCRERAKLPSEFNTSQSYVFLEPRASCDYVGTKNDCLFQAKYISDHHLKHLVHNAAIEAGLRIENRKICNSSVRIMCFKNQIDSGITGEEAQALDGHLSKKTRQHYDRGNEDNYDIYGAALSCAAFGSAAILPKPAGIRLTEDLPLCPPTTKRKRDDVTPTVLDLQRKEKRLRMSSGDEIRVCLPSFCPTFDNGEAVDLGGTLSASYKNHKASKFSGFRSNNTDQDERDLNEIFGTGLEGSDGYQPPPLPDLVTPFRGEILPRQDLCVDGEPVDSSGNRPRHRHREPQILKEIRNNHNKDKSKEARNNHNKVKSKAAKKLKFPRKKMKGDIEEDDPVLALTSVAGMTWPSRVVQVQRNEDTGVVEMYKVQLLGLNQSEVVKAEKVHPLTSHTYTRFMDPSFNKKKKILGEQYPKAMKTALQLAKSKGLVIKNLKEMRDTQDKEN